YPGYALGLSWPLKGHHLPELAPEGDAQLGKGFPQVVLDRVGAGRRPAVGSRRGAAERPISTEVFMETVAVVAALAGALFFGISSAADARSTKLVKTERALSPAILLDLVRQPLWLIGIVANVVGFALQVVALSFGSLALVQPLLVFDLVFAVIIIRSVGWDASRFPPGTRRSDPVLLAGVGADALGLGRF